MRSRFSDGRIEKLQHKPGGSSLGLPTSERIIAFRGGHIRVESEVGHGTQFTIELPVPARIAGMGES